MSLKFCFQHEIHRCSELPELFEALPSFLINKFKVELPSEFRLYYIDSDGQQITVSSTEDFQDLKERSSKRVIKVFITEKDEAQRSDGQASIVDESSSLNSDYGVIQHESQAIEPVSDSEVIQEEQKKDEPEFKGVEFNQEQIREVSDPLVEKLSQDLIENHIVPRLEGCKMSDSIEDQVSNVVRESLRNQMPFIVSQIKEALDKERLMRQESLPEAEKAEDVVVNKPAAIEQFFSKIISSIKKFPSKAAESIDDLTQKLEGDPYVYLYGKKFPLSIINRADSIIQIFPEADKEELLDFIAHYHKAVPVDKIAELYMIKKEL